MELCAHMVVVNYLGEIRPFCDIIAFLFSFCLISSTRLLFPKPHMLPITSLYLNLLPFPSKSAPPRDSVHQSHFIT